MMMLPNLEQLKKQNDGLVQLQKIAFYHYAETLSLLTDFSPASVDEVLSDAAQDPDITLDSFIALLGVARAMKHDTANCPG